MLVAVLTIRRFGDPVLRERAREVGTISDVHRKLVEDMLDTMRDAPGVGLAGPQVGVSERIFVFEVEGRPGVVIDPVLVELSDEKLVEDEGCLSIPGLTFPVERSIRAAVEGLDVKGEQIRIEGEGLLARVFQHEIDHLDGVLFIDRIDPELRKEALSSLRNQALGLETASPPSGSDI